MTFSRQPVGVSSFRVRWLGALTAIIALACGNPPPTCAATADAYRVCSNEQVWECPVATSEQLAAKKVLDDKCAMEADRVKCILNTKYPQFPMTLKADCKGGNELCKESTGGADAGVPVGTKSASCQPK